MEEFRIAHEQVVRGRRNFLIPVLLEDLSSLSPPDDLKLYLDTYTYLDVQGNNTLTRKKHRYPMPKTPLKDLKSLPPRRKYPRIRVAKKWPSTASSADINDEEYDDDS